MRELSVSMEGYTSYLGVPQDLKVRLGDDVELKCSASSSEEPSYYWQKEVRKPRVCTLCWCPHYTFGNLSVSLLLPSLDVTSLYFLSTLFSFQPHQVSAALLALCKPSVNCLSSSSTSLFLSLTFSLFLSSKRKEFRV